MTSSTSPHRYPITIERWDDPVITECGFDPHGPYLPGAWLAIIGPTAAWAYLALYDRCGETTDLAVLASALGVPQTRLERTLVRLDRFGLVRLTEAFQRVQVRTALPPLTRHQRARLGPSHPLAVTS